MGQISRNLGTVASRIYGDGRPILGEVVTLLNATFEKRILELIEARSRAMVRNEIHEIMTIDGEGYKSGRGSERASAIAFFEVEIGGVAVVGDEVVLGGKTLGRLVGFDLNHFPNHMNLVVMTASHKLPSIRVGVGVVIRRSTAETARITPKKNAPVKRRSK
jgi:hypothetical protein